MSDRHPEKQRKNGRMSWWVTTTDFASSEAKTLPRSHCWQDQPSERFSKGVHLPNTDFAFRYYLQPAVSFIRLQRLLNTSMVDLGHWTEVCYTAPGCAVPVISLWADAISIKLQQIYSTSGQTNNWHRTGNMTGQKNNILTYSNVSYIHVYETRQSASQFMWHNSQIPVVKLSIRLVVKKVSWFLKM